MICVKLPIEGLIPLAAFLAALPSSLAHRDLVLPLAALPSELVLHALPQ